MSLVKNTTLYTIGSLLPKIGSFIFLPIYLDYLSPSDYGIVNSLYVLNAIFVVLFSWSLPRSLYRIYYDYNSEKDRKTLLGTILTSVIAISLISIALIFILKDVVQQIYISIDFYPYYALAVLIVFFQVFHEIPNTLLQVKERAETFIKLNVSLFFVKSILIFYFLAYVDATAAGYLQAELIAVIAFIPFYYIPTYKYISLTWNRKIFKNILTFSLPIIPVILSAWILNLSDRIFIERYFSTEEVGIYSLGYQIAGLVLVLTGAFKQAYDPYFYKIANTYSKEEGVKKLYKTNYVFLLVVIFCCFLISFFSREGIELFFNSEYYLTIQIIPIIALAYFFSQNSALLNVMIYQEKKTKVIMYITFFSAIINIVLNFILIPRIGVFGAAWATVISFFMVFVLSYILAKKYYFVPYNWQALVPVFLLLVGMYVALYFLNIENVILSLIIKICIVAMIGAFFLYRNKEIIRKIYRSKK